MLHTLSRNWWVLVLRGILGIVFGLIAYAMPGVTLGVLVLLFGAYALIDGVFAIVATPSGDRSRPHGVEGNAGRGRGRLSTHGRRADHREGEA